MKRTALTTLAAAAAVTTATLAAPTAWAADAFERQAARAATEPAHGVFVYERLGATPTLRLTARKPSTPAPHTRAPTTAAQPFSAINYDVLVATPRIERAPARSAAERDADGQ